MGMSRYGIHRGARTADVSSGNTPSPRERHIPVAHYAATYLEEMSQG